MVFWLPWIYLIGHALAITIFPAHAQPLSFVFLIAAPLLAALACALRCRRGEVPGNWAALALGMALWGGGMATNMYQEVFLGNLDATPGASMLLYVLYGVPLAFTLGSAPNETWYVRVVDGVLAAALGYLFFVHTFAYATLSGTTETGVVNLRLMFDIENIFIASLAAVRYVASASPNRREFFRVLTLFACTYLVTAFYINHLVDADFGDIRDPIIDIPFLVLAVATYRTRPPVKPAPGKTRLTYIVRAASPLALPVTLLVVSALIARSHLRLAIAGFALATLGYGLRSILTQVRSFEKQEQLGNQARVDPLTGLFNRRHFEETLRREWNRMRRSDEGLALLMIDIDHFKRLNDSFGHPTGDATLRAVAQALAASAARASDTVARYGGEEFAAILPSLAAEDVARVAEAMRAAVERLQPAALGPGGKVTVSIGAGFVRAHTGDDPQALVAAADAALYEAKRSGRNRVIRRFLSPGEPAKA